MAHIDISWTNPTTDNFVEVELYKSESNILSQDRAYCAANAEKVYHGTGTSYADTDVVADTTYYYKIFAKYTISNIDYFSAGVGKAGNTTTPLYQPWSGFPDSPVLTSEYPYQMLWRHDTAYPFGYYAYYLGCTADLPIYITPDERNSAHYNQKFISYEYDSNTSQWQYIGGSNSGPGAMNTDYLPSGQVLQANATIYQDAARTTPWPDITQI